MTNVAKLGRRSFLAAMTAAGGAALSPRSALSQERGGFRDPLDATARKNLHRKLVWRLGEGLAAWSLRGPRSLLIEGVVTPLFDMHYGALFVTRDTGGADGEYQVSVIITQFYTDLKTGELVRKFVNPATGVASEVPYRTPKVARLTYNNDGPVNPTSEFAKRTATVHAPIVEDGQVWLEEDHSFVGAPANGLRGFRAADMTTYYAPVAEATNPAIKLLHSRQMFNDIVDALPWMGMGDVKASTFSRCYGYKVASIDAMSEPLRRLIKQEYPDIYQDPRKVLQK